MKKYIYIAAVVAVLGLVVAGIGKISGCRQTESINKTQQTSIVNPAKEEVEVKTRVIKETKTVKATETTPEIVTVTEVIETSGKASSSTPVVPAVPIPTLSGKLYIEAGVDWRIGKWEGPACYSVGCGTFITSNLAVGVSGSYFPEEGSYMVGPRVQIIF